jgi:hypothetical protein
MMQHLYRIRLREGAATSAGFWQAIRNPYEVHAMVWRIFSDGSKMGGTFSTGWICRSVPIDICCLRADPVDLRDLGR